MVITSGAIAFNPGSHMILKIWKHRIYVLQVCNLYKVPQIQAVLNRDLSIFFFFLFSVSVIIFSLLSAYAYIRENKYYLIC